MPWSIRADGSGFGGLLPGQRRSGDFWHRGHSSDMVMQLGGGGRIIWVGDMSAVPGTSISSCVTRTETTVFNSGLSVRSFIKNIGIVKLVAVFISYFSNW